MAAAGAGTPSGREGIWAVMARERRNTRPARWARAVRAAGFFAACGGYFGRMLRLGAVTGAVYAALFTWLHPYLFSTLWDRATRDMTSERDGLVFPPDAIESATSRTAEERMKL